jgi:probable FeS assembly SUF system protein SufT
MQGHEQVVTKRDISAIQIPDGTPFFVPSGSQLRLVQALGGNWTVATPWGALLRVDARDADAIGKQTQAGAEIDQEGALEERIWAQLRTCYDPEIPVDIVELGLIYGVELQPAEDGSDAQSVQVKMTLTAPGCGMGEILTRDVRDKVLGLRGVHDVDVELVFDPPWNQQMMSEAARLQLGMF